MRTKPFDGGPETSVKTSGFSFRKRLDGGYTIAFGQSNEVQIVPDSFRFFFDYLPQLRAERAAIRLSLGSRFMQEWNWARPRSLDQPSVYEENRIMDPKPLTRDLAAARANLYAAFPAFRQAEIAQEWGGLIDATPDAVPAISAVDSVPGLFISTGYSGHGFGIGPGAGKLTADIVAGDPPVVDPTPYRVARFSEGRRSPSKRF
jgi:glycine/D-amino acid oxidase-like deaminating enzyme